MFFILWKSNSEQVLPQQVLQSLIVYYANILIITYKSIDE